jgi:hypothetical protein
MGIKDWSDKASDYLDTKGLANPVEVVNEALGGESREESKKRREAAKQPQQPKPEPVKKAKGGMIGSASKRADGIAVKGKTRGRMV